MGDRTGLGPGLEPVAWGVCSLRKDMLQEWRQGARASDGHPVTGEYGGLVPSKRAKAGMQERRYEQGSAMKEQDIFTNAIKG